MRQLFLFVLLAALIPGCATTPVNTMSAEERFSQAQTFTASWHAHSKEMALKIMDEYGPPDQIFADLLVWYNTGSWNKVAVWDTEDYNYSDALGPATLEQTLFDPVPQAKRRALADFSDGISVSEDGKKLSVRSNSEALVYLTFNLAHEIVQGAKGPSEARLFYDRTYKLSLAGKSSPYMQWLLFPAQPGDGFPQF